MGEQRFKVGDWVRSLVDWGSVEAGKVYKIPHLDNEGEPWFTSDGSGGWCDYLTLGEIEPWQPRVGERVRVKESANIMWAGEGAVHEARDEVFILKMKTGKNSGHRGGFLINELEPILSTATTEQPATLKIEEGKFYKTRDGRKVGPMVVDRQHDRRYGWTVTHEFNAEYGKAWRADGTFHPDVGTTHGADLVAEWANEPASKANASNDNAQPKFKVGDRVRLARSFSGVAKVGATATVDKRGMFDGYIDIVWDKNSLHQGQMDGGYSPDYFELLPPAPSAHTTIVALIENGQPKPSSTPHVHASTGAAEKEARRLAAKFKGKQFGVFTLTTTHEEPAPVYDHKWQNLAALGLKIDAIKELRSITGMGLKPAKDAVEYFLAAA